VLLCSIVCRRTNVSLITVPASGEAIVVIMTIVLIVTEAWMTIVTAVIAQIMIMTRVVLAVMMILSVGNVVF
jgi:hypothetical protein